MMTQSIVKAIVKHGGKVDSNGNQFYLTTNGKFGSWYDQGGRAICVHVRRVDDRPDGMSDYFPGHYCRTVKDFVQELFPDPLKS